jgi:hypothetical protein
MKHKGSFDAFEKEDIKFVRWLGCTTIYVPHDRVRLAKLWLEEAKLDIEVKPNDKRTSKTPEDFLPEAKAAREAKEKQKQYDAYYKHLENIKDSKTKVYYG